MDIEKLKIKNKFLTVLLFFSLILIILLVLFIIFSNKPILNRNNNSLKVINSSYIEHDENTLIVEVQNNSSTDYLSVEPFAIFYDENNIPVYTSTSSVIELFQSGKTKYLSFYGIPKNYSKFEIGLSTYDEGLDQDFEYYNKILNNVSYNTELSVDEDGNDFIILTGKNNSDIEIDTCFQIVYRSEDEIIYIDDYWVAAEPNSDFNDEIYLTTEYLDGTSFPTGYTYDINLVDISTIVINNEDEDYNTPIENIEEDDSLINIDETPEDSIGIPEEEEENLTTDILVNNSINNNQNEAN